MRVVKLFHQLTAAAALGGRARRRAGADGGAATWLQVTPTELERDEKVAMEFFRPGADRVALAGPDVPATTTRRSSKADAMPA